MPALTQAQLADPRVRELIAAAFRTPRSLSPALEGDLAAFCCAPDFARAVERVGEVEQGGAALPFALGGQFCRADAHLVWIEPLPRSGPSWVEETFLHAPKLRPWAALHQCDWWGVSHPENGR